jgi:hypothetical protein
MLTSDDDTTQWIGWLGGLKHRGYRTFPLRRNKARYLIGTFPHSPRLEPDLPL